MGIKSQGKLSTPCSRSSTTFVSVLLSGTAELPLPATVKKGHCETTCRYTKYVMRKKQKILYVVTKSVWGGAQRYVFDLAIHLPPDRFEPMVAAGGEGLLFEKLQKAGVRTISIPELERDISLIKDLKVLRELYNIFKKEEPQVIHLNSSKMGGLGALASFLYKLFTLNFKLLTIYTVHGWPFKEERPLFARWTIFLASFFSASLCDRVILINTADFKIARKFIPRRKLVLIYNGIDSPAFLSSEKARALLSRTIGRQIDPKTILIGTIAELTSNKGINYFISALSRSDLDSRHRNLTSIIIGGGEDHEILEKSIKTHNLWGLLFLAGFINDAHNYLQAFDIFVLPSLKEGLPYTIMEAMSAGLPTIATRVGGIPDLIEHRKEGILVSPKNSVELASALEELVKNTQYGQMLGRNAREKIARKFLLGNMIKNTLMVYNEQNSPY